jgi:site-specific DNA-methyltransferase (adenine-specific)
MSLEHNDKISWVEIKTLKPHPKNPNKHSKEQIKRLAEIIKYQGFRSPVVVSNRSGYIVAGHGRVEAAIQNGLSKVPVSYQDFTDDEQEYAHMTADNAIADWATLDLSAINKDIIELGPDFNIDMLGIKDFEIEPADKYADKDADAIPEKVEPKAKLGQIYKLGEHRLMCGDSTDLAMVEKLMDGEKADLYLTDCPYGVSMEAREKSSSSWVNKDRVHSKIENDDRPLSEMKIFWTDVATAAIENCSDEASYYWFACQGGDQMMMMMALGDAGWAVKHELIWVKDQMCFGRADYHYKHEPIIYGWKRKGKHNWYGDRKQVSTIECPRPKKSDLHPTMKPIELLAHLLGNSSKTGSKVLDTFGGSGSTLIACEKTNRKCFMMELDPHYIDIIIARWEQFTGKKAELVNG